MNIADNDMEIIMNASDAITLRKMLRNRVFCLIEMPIEKPQKIVNSFSSSIFVSFINRAPLFRTFAIRGAGTDAKYSECQYYLAVYFERGLGDEQKNILEQGLERKREWCTSITYPTIDELIAFLQGKELFLITCYMYYGNMESLKVADFLNKLLLLREDSEAHFIMRDEMCDIKVYLSSLSDKHLSTQPRLNSEDIRKFDIGRRIVGMLKEKSRKYYSGEDYYSTEYEVRTPEIQASYFITRFHSNHEWNADPVNIVNSRISVYILPGVASIDCDNCTSQNLVRDLKSRTEYLIDSIYCNSDSFYSLEEFEKYIDSYFEYFMYD